MSLAIRTSADPTALAGAVRKQILAVDPAQPIYQVQTMQDMVEGSLAKHRLSMFLLSVFAAAALLLSVIGIYGVISYWVSQRTREIGMRVALGAGRLDVLRLVMHESVLLVAAGAAAGFLASLALNRLIASLLFGVKPGDPLTFVMVAVLMAIVALAASALPAHRAMQVHPMVALRYE
jgi:putative ABC transport system permease protein